MADADDSTEPKKSHLTTWIVAAIVLAIIVALVVPAVLEKDAALSFFHAVSLGGEIFLRLLKMMVVPLVVASVMSGILGLGDVRKLGKPGGYAVLYYLSTTILAVTVGLIVVNIYNPGKVEKEPQQAKERERETTAGEAKRKVLKRIAEETKLKDETIAQAIPDLEEGLDKNKPSLGTILHNLVLMLFSDNLFASAVKMDLLPLIVFSIIFAGMLTTMGQRSEIIANFVLSINDALLNFVLLLMKVAPIGIFCLVAARFAKAQLDGQFLALIRVQFYYMSTVLIGLFVHALITLPLLLWVFTRRNPYRFLMQMSQAVLTAFSTASSTATLPVSMECAEANAGVSRRSTEFVLPLGATINMDGTALYEAAGAIFIAQAYSVVDPSFELTGIAQVTIAITATLAAIGAAGIPEAGLVTMLIVLNAVGLPIEMIGLVLPVDWLLDRFRTAVNAFGDSVGAAIVDKSFEAADAANAASAQAEASQA